MHATKAEISPGELILSPSERGEAPASWGPSLERAIAMGHYRDDRVYLFHGRGVHVRNFINSYVFTSGDGVHVYEVEPLGELEKDPDPTAQPNFACCPRARVIRKVWPLGAAEQLRDRVDDVIRQLGGVIAGTSSLQNALACYVPSVPPRFLYRAELDPDERGRAFVHELCHAALHPPGSPVSGEHEDLFEERCAHVAADRICRLNDVHDYREIMASHSVAIEQALAEDEPVVSEMLARVSAVLEHPELATAWTAIPTEE